MDDPVYRRIYYDEMAVFLQRAFQPEATQALIRAARDLISPYVVGPEGERPGYSLTTPEDFSVFTTQMLDHVRRRHDEALAAVAASK
jgi:hypothetical protein